MPLTPEEQEELNALEAEIGGLTPEEFIEMQELETELAPKGFLGRVGEDITQRAFEAGDIEARRERGEIGAVEEGFQLMGKAGAGLVGDIAGEAVQSGVEALSTVDEALGGPGAGFLSGAAGAIGDIPLPGGTSVGEVLPQKIEQLGQAYGEFAQESPRAATNVEAAANLAMIAPVFKYGEDIITSVGKIKKSLSKPEIQKLTSEQVRETASTLFNKADELGGQLKPEFMDDFIRDVNKITPQTEIGVALKGEDEVSRIIKAITEVKDTPLTLKGMQEADEILGNLAFKHTDDFGKLDADGRKLMEIQTILRDKINTAPPEMFMSGSKGFEVISEARKYWAASLRLRDVERIIQKAEGAAQPSTVIKNGFRSLRDNGRRMKGYSPQEAFAIKKAAKDGLLGGFLKLSGSGLVPIIAGATGAAATGGPGALAAIPAFAAQQSARRGATALQASKGEAVKQAIRESVFPAPKRDIAQAIRATGAPLAIAAPIGAANLLTQQRPTNGFLRERAIKLLADKRALREETE